MQIQMTLKKYHQLNFPQKMRRILCGLAYNNAEKEISGSQRNGNLYLQIDQR